MKLTTLERLAFMRPDASGNVVLAHGCFDVVHPGHIRHLQWAKAQGDVLVCSVTSDRYVNKGPNRPWVPELLRCENVAALECVDYVVLNDQADAMWLIQELRPDVFVKGFEYKYRDDRPTLREQDAVTTYGGRVLFSPNDVVYSSTELGPPQIDFTAGIFAPRFTLPDFSGLRVHVIGDAILDVYTQAKCLGAASKSPTLVYERGPLRAWEGGASVVAKHCEEAGAQVTLWARGATVKERIVVDGMKVCEFHSRPPVEPWRDPVLNEPVDVVIFADFGLGAIDRETITSVREGYPGALLAADSQTSGTAWGNILDFKGCDLLFANEKEARFALRGQPTDDLEGSFLRAALDGGTRAVFLKRGAQGLSVAWDGGRRDHVALATQPITDPIGAGDALLAYATLTYAVTKDLELAGQIGSLAAAEACAHEGNVPVTREQVKARAWR